MIIFFNFFFFKYIQHQRSNCKHHGKAREWQPQNSLLSVGNLIDIAKLERGNFNKGHSWCHYCLVSIGHSAFPSFRQHRLSSGPRWRAHDLMQRNLLPLGRGMHIHDVKNQEAGVERLLDMHLIKLHPSSFFFFPAWVQNRKSPIQEP